MASGAKLNRFDSRMRNVRPWVCGATTSRSVWLANEGPVLVGTARHAPTHCCTMQRAGGFSLLVHAGSAAAHSASTPSVPANERRPNERDDRRGRRLIDADNDCTGLPLMACSFLPVRLMPDRPWEAPGAAAGA